MTGLILKDFLVMKKTLVYMLVMTALFGGVYTSMDSNYFLSYFLSIMMVGILISTISYDEFYHWDRYAATVPLSRRQVVLSRYLFSYILFFAGTMFAAWLQLAAMYLKSQPITGEEIAIMTIAPAVGLIGMAVALPCSYRFGVQKSRLVMLAMYGIPSLLLVTALKLMPDLFREEPKIQLGIGAIVGGLYGVTVVFQAVSFLISVRVMEKKEL